MPTQGKTQFVVDLGDVQLPPDAAKRLSTEIRRIVLSSLARVDLKGDLQVSTRLPKDFGGRTDGIWVDIAAERLGGLKR